MAIYYHFYKYITNSNVSLATDESRAIRSMVFNFKDGVSHTRVASLMEDFISDVIKKDHLRNVALVCIPASTVVTNNLRYKRFTDEVCSSLNIANGFDHISIVREKSPKHLGGDATEAQYAFDADFFKNKNIILFDDILTSGRSMRNFTAILERFGASVKYCVTIGKTWNPRYEADYNPVHPYTETYALIQPYDGME